jgi:hypothetical protein
VPPETALDVAAEIRTHARRVARVFTKLFLESVWQPFNEAGRPEEEWPQVRVALELLRPLASEALLAIFQQTMSEAVEQAWGRELQREVGRPAERDKRPAGRRSRRRVSRSRAKRRRV